MSNQIDHRVPRNKKNKRHNERPNFACGCSDEGHNGQIGRRKWKRLEHRNERRNAKQGRPATIGKMIKKTFSVTPHDDMGQIGEFRTIKDVGKIRTGKPRVIDTGEE